MGLIKQKRNESLGYRREFVEQYNRNRKDKEVAEALEKKQLPKGKEVKMKKSFYLYVGDTIFSVWFNGHEYRFINLSNNKISWVYPGEGKTLGREGEIGVDKTDTQASRNHLNLRVDDESNLFLCDISKHGTLINSIESKEKKKNKITRGIMTPEEVNNFRDSKKSKEAEYFYKMGEEYKPTKKINLGNGNIMYITNCLTKKNEDHTRVIGYIKVGESFQLRMFFKSVSEGAWRVSPGLRESDGKYSKGEKINNFQYETTTKVVPGLSTIFNILKKDETSLDPIDKSEKFGADFLIKDMEKEVEVDTLFSSKELMDYLIYRVGKVILGKNYDDYIKGRISDLIAYYNKKSDKNSILSSASRIMSVKRKGGKDSIPFEISKGIFDRLVPIGLNYMDMYKVEGESYQNKHDYFGIIDINVYETTWNGKKIKIHFGSAKNNHPEKIWIDNITYSDDEVNTFGTYQKPINAAPLVAKPADYEDQCPSFGSRRLEFQLSYNYMDIRDLYQDNPIIKHYKKLEGLL